MSIKKPHIRKGSLGSRYNQQTAKERARTYATASPEQRGAMDNEDALEAVTQERDKLEEIAVTDQLTNLSNRRGLLSALNTLLLAQDRRHAQNSGEENSRQSIRRDMDKVAEPEKRNVLLFVDLQDFKSVNDTYGMQKGDELLCAIANTLTEQKRPGDMVARLGGDEFVLVIKDIYPDLPSVNDTSKTNLDVVLERASEAIKKATIETKDGPLTRGGDVGATIIPPDATISDITAMIDQADQRRLEKKRERKGDTPSIEH